MAEIDPLDRLVRLARQEEPPPCGEAAATMDRIRALRGVEPAARFTHWKRAAVILAAAAAAVVAVVILPRGTRNAPPVVANADVTEYVVPTLDILGSLEKEVNQLLSGAG
jgi:hypothetical protein